MNGLCVRAAGAEDSETVCARGALSGASGRPVNFTVKLTRSSVEPPDRLEKGIRFCCGFVFGFWLSRRNCRGLTYSLWHAHYVVASCVVVALLCGYGAMKNETWRQLLE